ncbi:minor tail protein [Mycobacterium phage Mask]|nr:minor tail protein [Mycobacterium phage Sejanus]UVT31558.1 minor tail protein [Mycobacterium phage Mask]
MPYRGWFALNGVEIANSSRVAAHLGNAVPLSDVGMFGPTESEPCELVEVSPGLYAIPESSVEVLPGLGSVPDGARRFGPGLLEMGPCWGPADTCSDCNTLIDYDDTWPGLPEFLGDSLYRPELAPWYSTQLPESGEFGGVWMLKVDGLDTTPVDREITQMAGAGGAAGPSRDPSRTVTFEAVLVACTHAGVDFGLKWLTCLLRDTTTSTTSTLRYLAASPSYSGVDPLSLVREVHGVVLTKAPTIAQEYNTEARQHQQATMYRITWEMAVLAPYAYLPSVRVPVDWDDILRQPVNWIHAPDCAKPETCEDMPVMFSTECVPEQIPVVTTPPPVCGGCLPVGEIDKYVFRVPTMDYAFRCNETAVTTILRNTGAAPLTLQAFWRECGSDVRCEDNRWPLQIAGLPAGAELVLDGVTGRFWANYDERVRRVVGVVGTPHGAPWRPPLIDRQTCWEFIVQTAASSEFEMELVLHDREP